MAALAVCLVLLCLPAMGQDNCSPKLKPADQAKYNQAIEAYNQGKYISAADQLRKLSAKYPKSADIFFYLGMTAVHRDFNAAGIRRYFGKLYTLCPDYPNALAHYYHGIICYTDEDFESAVMDFNRFFEMANQAQNPDYDAVYSEASNYLYWSEFLAEAHRNQVPFQPRVIKGASSTANEMLPYLTVDGKSLYYLRQVTVSRGATFYTKEFEDREIRMFVSTRQDSVFSPGSELLPPFNLHSNEGGVTMTADNKTLYYSVMMPGKNNYNNCDIYYTTLRDGKWAPIQNAGVLVNGARSWESQPSITPDGQYLYFASNREGGMGGIDIWRCHRLPNGDWSRAENLGPSVNTSGNEKCPFIHPDGKTLYFASNGWQGFGGYDMYFINVADIHAQRPTNMGLPINTAEDDICFGITTDGLQGYFGGKSPDWVGVGGRDLFFFDLYPSARPESMRVAQSRLAAPNGRSLPGIIKLQRYGADDAIYLADSVDGEFVMVLSQEEDNLVSAQMDGYMPFVMQLPAAKVRRGMVALPKTITLQPATVGSKHPLADGIYDFKSKSITDFGKKVLSIYAAYLQEHPMMHIAVESRNAEEAKAVSDYFSSQRLRSDRLSHRTGTDVPRLQLKITQ